MACTGALALHGVGRTIDPTHISLVHPQSESLPPPERLPDDVYEDLAQEQCERMPTPLTVRANVPVADARALRSHMRFGLLCIKLRIF
jgi:hypothetical protein